MTGNTVNTQYIKILVRYVLHTQIMYVTQPNFKEGNHGPNVNWDFMFVFP